MVTGTIFEFGDFKLDCECFELRRAGHILKLERKPMELLILLAERSGHVVTRTEIAGRLWEREVFVDTEHGINTAVRKIRQALRDDPEQPRFVQTVTGRGYRFIAPISGNTPAPAPAAHADGFDAVPAAAGMISIRAPGQSSNDRPDIIPASSHGGYRFLWIALMGAVVAGLCLVLAFRLIARSGAHGHAGAAALKIRSLAVIPLDNFSSDAGQEYLADGMTDELTTMLAKDSTLRVISRTSVMQYKGAHRPLRQIAKELGVDGILEGSVARSGDKVHLNIQLIDAATDTHVWAESYDRDANDLVSLPQDAAQTIAKQLNSAITQPVKAKYISSAAHDAYLHGMYLWYRGQYDGSYPYFARAVELQPDYALGWSGIAFYYGASVDSGEVNLQEYIPKMEASSVKAVQLDATLPQAHLAMSASDFMGHWDWAGAEREIQGAMALDPEYGEAPHFYAKELLALNRPQEAIAEQKKAMALDAFSRPWALTMVYVMARQYDDAIADARARLVSLPHDDGLYGYMAEAYRCKGMQKEAIELKARAIEEGGDKAWAARLRRLYQQGGYRAVLLEQVEFDKRESAMHEHSPIHAATAYAELGDREETLKLLEETVRRHDPAILYVQTEPAFDFLHGDERYRSIIRKVGLPPAY